MNNLNDLPIWTDDHARPVQVPSSAPNGRVCNQIYVAVPFSEVCMHMRIAGKRMKAELRFTENGYASVQLYQIDGTPFSSPITTGEAGFYQNGAGYYAYHPRIQPSEYERILKVQLSEWITKTEAGACKEVAVMRQYIIEHTQNGVDDAIPQFSLEIARCRAIIWTLEKLQVFLHTGE